MKVCILSMQKVPNFGSLLQSYSLKKMVESLGHSVDFIDIERIEEDDELLYKDKVSNYQEGEVITGIFSRVKKIDRYFFNRLRVKRIQKTQDIIFAEFRKEVLHAEDVDNENHFDICIIGSDEVFNCLNPAPWGFTSQLFGNVRQAEKVITYAASCGSTNYENVPDPVRLRIGRAFKNISAFSVRDENTLGFVKKLSAEPIELNLDPVVVGNFDDEMAKVGDISNKLPSHYCIVYSYYNRICDNEDIKNILSFCKSNNLTPVSIGAPQKWIKDHIALNPFEMLVAFKKADFVITDTFHGTIFSAKYADKFAVIIRESNKNKLGDLVARLNLQKHLVSDISKLENQLNVINTNKIKSIIDVERKRTISYLKERLV